MRATRSVLVLGSILLTAGLRAQVPVQELPRGQVVARVACSGDPAHAYALFLPSTYTPERKWPVIFCFDPGGAGERPVHLLEKAAETYGYILMGSWEARNGPLQPIADAQNALWKEARARFAVEEGRCYAAGFSGGARASVRMALDHPKAFAGVLCCGAFVPGDRSLPKTLPFAVYATVGTEDFNLFELYQGDRDLTKGGTPHWVEVFPGPHRWAAPELLREGVEFFQVCAMRKGQLAADAAWQHGLVTARLATADALKASGALLSALWKYRQTGVFFAGLPGADRAASEAAALAQDPQVKVMLETEGRLETALDRLRHCESLEDYQREFAALEKMSQAEGYDGVRARYALTVSAQDLSATGLMSLQRGNCKSAAALLELAVRADPNDPLPAYNAACAYSRLNQRKEALAMLGRAVDAGFRDAKLLRDDPDLANARKDPGFAALQAWLEQPAVK
jgi:predicted esterase